MRKISYLVLIFSIFCAPRALAENAETESILAKRITSNPSTYREYPPGYSEKILTARDVPPGYQEKNTNQLDEPKGYREYPSGYLEVPRGYKETPPDYIEKDSHPVVNTDPSIRLGLEEHPWTNNSSSLRIPLEDHPLADKRASLRLDSIYKAGRED